MEAVREPEVRPQGGGAGEHAPGADPACLDTRSNPCIQYTRTCTSATGFSCCANVSSPRAAATTFDFAWSPTLRARTVLAVLRLSYGMSLLSYAIWSWCYSSNASLSFFRIFAQLTTWGLIFSFVFFCAAGAAGLGAPRTGNAAQACGRTRGCLAFSAPALFATAFTFEVTITVLAWALFGEFETGSLGIFIVNHIQLLPLIVDLGVSRITVRWRHMASPLVNYVLYIAVAGIYSVSAQRGPYDALTFSDAGTTTAAIFIALGAIIVSFFVLKILSDARDRGVASASINAGRENVVIS